ncbi:MAG: hypothetical protein K8F91_07580, partial [Candidatus Obscuribacterales bacterium]|nr:hypothetical protein [Candidatus Obscuribacterales bacterium]
MTAGSNFEAPINDSQFKTSDASLGSGGGEKNLFTEVMDDIQKSGIDEGVRQLRVASMEMMGGKADPADKGFPPADSVMDTGKATEQGDKNFDQA